MKSILTKDFGITNAKNFEQMITVPLANVYILIGSTNPWPNTANLNLLDDVTISAPYDTTDYKYDTQRSSILIKKITNSDVQAVIPRIDWANNNVYVSYDQTLNLFSKTSETLIAGGTVNVSSLSLQTVNSASINLAISVPSISIGSFIKINTEIKEVVKINAVGDFITVNTPFASAYTQNNIYKLETSDLYYANQFYVRNNVDQVFKCLRTSNTSNSVIMPEITIGGQLPENPYIQTSDGYKWKYMYTIATGVKNKFFTDKYMPVIRDQTVYDNSYNGRIDIIEIIDGGSGYFNGGSVNNYSIATVTGDGSNASITVDVSSGMITNVNFINRGNNYTVSDITFDDPLQLGAGNTANLRVIISPQYGHGNDVMRELGASDQMISVNFTGDESGALPTISDGTQTFRQIGILKDPKFSANSLYATGTIYPMCTKIYTSNPASDFAHNSIIYAGASYATSTFSARVIHFDTGINLISVNDISGDIDSITGSTIYEKDNPSTAASVYLVEKPDINIYTGELLYIQNREKIIRSLDQTETLKLVVEF